MEFPVEYRFAGRSRPTITTPVVNSRLNPTPSKTVSTERAVGSDTVPQSRNPVA
jgi:hypothetical protein